MKTQKEYKEYPVRGFRIDDRTWDKLKKLRKKQSWNMFFLELIKLKEENGKRPKSNNK